MSTCAPQRRLLHRKGNSTSDFPVDSENSRANSVHLIQALKLPLLSNLTLENTLGMGQKIGYAMLYRPFENRSPVLGFKDFMQRDTEVRNLSMISILIKKLLAIM